MAGIDSLVFAADTSLYPVADYKYRPPPGKTCNPYQQSQCENLFLQTWRTCLAGAITPNDYFICDAIKRDLSKLCANEFGCGSGQTCLPDANTFHWGTCCPAGTASVETFACNGQCLACSGDKVPDRACISCQCPPGTTECMGDCIDNMTVPAGPGWQTWRAQHQGTPVFTCPNDQFTCDPSLVTIMGPRGPDCCPPGNTQICGDKCTNTQGNPLNCGSCGHACGQNEQCVNGGCGCKPGTRRCHPTDKDCCPNSNYCCDDGCCGAGDNACCNDCKGGLICGSTPCPVCPP